MHSRFKALEKYDLGKLQSSTVAIVGLGATGSVMAEHIARHGINLILIDRDYLEINDLYSSNLYSREQCESALPKAKAAEQKLQDVAEVESYVQNLDSSNTELLEDADIILDGTDNLETRLVLDQYSSLNNVPWIYTAALGERGFSMFLEDNCFRCMFEKLDPASSCQQNGVMREISSIAASTSSIKAIRKLSGLEVDQRLEMLPEGRKFEAMECTCNDNEEIKVSSVCGENKYQVFGSVKPENFQGNVVTRNKYLSKINFEGTALTVFKSGRAIIKADSREEAQKVYKKASSI